MNQCFLGFLVVMGFVAYLAASAPISGASILRRHINNYANMNTIQAVSSSLSQEYPDLGSRSVLTAFSVDLYPNETVSIDGIKMDFMVGRRLSQHSGAPMNFSWDALGNVMFSVELRIMADCNGREACGSCPCDLIRTYSLTPQLNAAAFYTSFKMGWGNVYQVDFLLARDGTNIVMTRGAGSSVAHIWFVFLGVLNETDTSAGYEYTFRLPVSSEVSTADDLMINDPHHLINTSWDTWQRGSTISSAYYSNTANPQVGFLVVGRRTTSPTPHNSSTPIDNPFNVTPTLSEPAKGPDNKLPTPVIAGIVIGSIIGLALLITIGFVIAYNAFVYAKRRRDARHLDEMEMLNSNTSHVNLDESDFDNQSDENSDLVSSRPANNDGMQSLDSNDTLSPPSSAFSSFPTTPINSFSSAASMANPTFMGTGSPTIGSFMQPKSAPSSSVSGSGDAPKLES